MDTIIDQKGQWRHARADVVARSLTRCLRDLDAIDEGVIAAHVSMALEKLKREYRLDTAD